MVSESVTLNGDVLGGVIQISERGVHPDEHRKIIALLNRVKWDDLLVLQKVAECSSFRCATKFLQFSLNTVRARIDRLEKALETKLLIRNRHGVQITAEGKIVLAVFEEMQMLGSKLPIGAGNNSLVKEGEVRICVSEGLGTFWLTPRLALLKKTLPNLVVALDSFADQNCFDPDKYDIVIGYSQSKDLEAISCKIAMVHMMPFASENYLAKHGEPRSFDEVVGHQCVQHEAPSLNYDALGMFLGEQAMKQVVSIRVSSSHALFSAIVSGIGIGALPTYISALSRRVRPLELPIKLKFEVWMSFSKSARDSAPVRKAIDWIRESFDSTHYPWFAENFMHPNEFDEAIKSQQVVLPLDCMID